jgi:hypothetical protein
VGAQKSGRRFIGGKHDDISVIIAQFHVTDSDRMVIDAQTEFFEQDKFIYTDEHGSVPDMKWSTP